MNVVERYRRWYEYELDAHAKVLASLRAVPQAQQNSVEYRKALSLLAHIAAARQLWLFRFGVLTQPPHSISPKGLPVEEVEARLNEVQSAWMAYLERLDDAGVARTFEYTSLEGEGFRNTVEDILAQLFGHSSYHRGQIAALVRALGCEPAETDFVYWTREPSGQVPGRASR